MESLTQDSNIREAANIMGDIKLITRLSEGDMVARKALYHKNCMSKFTNRFRTFANTNKPNVAKIEQNEVENIAMMRVMSFIEENLMTTNNLDIAPYVKLSAICKFYCL